MAAEHHGRCLTLARRIGCEGWMRLPGETTREAHMISWRTITAAPVAFILMLAPGMPAAAAEIKVFCGSGISEVIDELGPRFEQMTGHKLVVRFDFAGPLIRAIDADQPFDVAILSTGTDDLI